LLAERGIDSVSVAAVAERAGVHETSIYRRWGTRDNLLLLSAVHRLQTEVPIPDTGSLCGDVRELLRGMAVFVQSPFGEVLQRVASQTQSHEHDASRDAFLAERRSVVDAVLQRAAARGELRQDVDASVVFDALLGPLNRRVTITREPLDDAFLEGLAGIITLGIGAQRRRQPAAASRRPSS
jgi:AcrR family transcriptional regulator